VLLGDFNIYDTDPALHRWTLVHGDIQNEGRYGPDLSPDWDGSSLADALPSHNGLGDQDYTWRNDAEPFRPGALDRIFFTDSALQVVNSFVLNTALMTDEALARYGLVWDDVVLDAQSGNYDHLPVVVDFALAAGR
jgi:hypothetical protein